jgi:DNA-directed RNA polymerase subunit M/transcription elongation factor TFIIS
MGKTKSANRCPKCGGNLYIEKDHHGWYEQCLQCAYMRDLPMIYEHKKPVKMLAEEVQRS